MLLSEIVKGRNTPASIQRMCALHRVRQNVCSKRSSTVRRTRGYARFFGRHRQILPASNFTSTTTGPRRGRSSKACFENWAPSLRWRSLLFWSPLCEISPSACSNSAHSYRQLKIAPRRVGICGAPRRSRGAMGSMHSPPRCFYSAAKLDEQQGDWPVARNHLAASAVSARIAGHAVCLRIAEMREFWLGVRHEGAEFEYGLFAARARQLEFLESHAWARRYAAQSRLWAARELERSGDRAGMRELLRRNIDSFELAPEIPLEFGSTLGGFELCRPCACCRRPRARRRKRRLAGVQRTGMGGGLDEHQGAGDPSAYWRRGA